jgi:hypothetical protein
VYKFDFPVITNDFFVYDSNYLWYLACRFFPPTILLIVLLIQNVHISCQNCPWTRFAGSHLFSSDVEWKQKVVVNDDLNITDIQTFTKRDGDTNTIKKFQYQYYAVRLWCVGGGGEGMKTLSFCLNYFGRHNCPKTHVTRHIITFCHTAWSILEG